MNELKKEARELYVEAKGMGYAENEMIHPDIPKEDKILEEKFVALIDKATTLERERCAEVAADLAMEYQYDSEGRKVGMDISRAILTDKEEGV